MIEFTISSFWVIFLIIFSIIELSLIISTKVFFIHRIFLFLRVYFYVRKTIPKWWKLNSYGLSFFTINKNHTQNKIHPNYGKYHVYVKLDRDKNMMMDDLDFWPDDTKVYTNDFVILNFFGEIVSEKFTNSIDYWDSFSVKEIKKYKRDKALNSIGI